jgi:hypothetical protein
MFWGRGKNKVQNKLTINDIYNDFINQFPEDSIYNKISKKLYTDIISSYYKAAMEYILKKGGDFKLPRKLGILSVRKKKVNYRHQNRWIHIDWKSTVDNNTTVYHLNEHTNGYKYFFYWNKYNYAFKNKTYYRFVATRANKRNLAQLIKSGNYDYFEI